MTRMLLAGICALDAMIGDPPAFPHPVRSIGALIAYGERRLRAGIGDSSAIGELAAGAVLSAVVVAAASSVTALFVRVLGNPAIVVSGAAALAARSLDDAILSVELPLSQGDLTLARTRVAAIVGRDTAHLDAADVARAAIEAAAESLCDGVIAPLLALRLGGVVAVWAYKAINTLDSMIGHIEPPYTHFGRFAARADDIANFLPARLTVFFIAAAAALLGEDARGALAVARRDGTLHRSPNAGWCEAAMAGALRRRLGGTNVYDGVVVHGPSFGSEYDAPSVTDVGRARKLVRAAVLLAMILAILSAQK